MALKRSDWLQLADYITKPVEEPKVEKPKESAKHSTIAHKKSEVSHKRADKAQED